MSFSEQSLTNIFLEKSVTVKTGDRLSQEILFFSQLFSLINFIEN